VPDTDNDDGEGRDAGGCGGAGCCTLEDAASLGCRTVASFSFFFTAAESLTLRRPFEAVVVVVVSVVVVAEGVVAAVAIVCVVDAIDDDEEDVTAAAAAASSSWTIIDGVGMAAVDAGLLLLLLLLMIPVVVVIGGLWSGIWTSMVLFFPCVCFWFGTRGWVHLGNNMTTDALYVVQQPN
jgi:hypothetical protein